MLSVFLKKITKNKLIHAKKAQLRYMIVKFVNEATTPHSNTPPPYATSNEAEKIAVAFPLSCGKVFSKTMVFIIGSKHA